MELFVRKLVARSGSALLAASLLSGCLYANIRYPLDEDVNKTVLGEKVGRADMQSVLWLFAWGDASTRAAAAQGDITTITHLDVESQVIFFGLYTRRTTIAYGD